MSAHSIQFDLTTDDLRTFLRYEYERLQDLHDKANPPTRRWLWVLISTLGLLLILASALAAPAREGPRTPVPVALVAVGVFVAGILWSFNRRKLLGWWSERVGMSRAAAVLGPYTLEIAPEGYTIGRPLTTVTSDWRLLDRVEIAPDYLFLYLTEGGAYIVPKRAFESPAEADEFVRLVGGYCTWAHERAAGVPPST